jgi:ZIP family zinc transporter
LWLRFIGSPPNSLIENLDDIKIIIDLVVSPDARKIEAGKESEMSVLSLAIWGGFISFASTSLGALSSRFIHAGGVTRRWSFSIDFALGLMVSASAFTLIGPVAFDSGEGPGILSVALATLAGAAFVGVMKASLAMMPFARGMNVNHILLVAVLMLHNFPEGMASGAAVAGLGWTGSLPILGGIAIQNIPEGALMVVSLRALGWSPMASLAGGIGSGGVEWAGGLLAGVLLNWVDGALPYLLSFAGGAMMTSVLLELAEGRGKALHRVLSAQFASGFILLPLLQLLFLRFR